MIVYWPDDLLVPSSDYGSPRGSENVVDDNGEAFLLLGYKKLRSVGGGGGLERIWFVTGVRLPTREAPSTSAASVLHGGGGDEDGDDSEEMRVLGTWHPSIGCSPTLSENSSFLHVRGEGRSIALAKPTTVERCYIIFYSKHAAFSFETCRQLLMASHPFHENGGVGNPLTEGSPAHMAGKTLSRNATPAVSLSGSLLKHGKSISMMVAHMSRKQKSSCLIDRVLGLLMGVWGLTQAHRLARLSLLPLNFVFNGQLQTEMRWLSHNPVGLKLNNPLMKALEKLSLVPLNAFVSLLPPAIPYAEHAVQALSVLSLLAGLSAGLALLYDLIRLLTLHIKFVYTFTSCLHGVQSYILQSLWLLFRGKKRNVLRMRKDSLAYDSKQLMLGTVLFTSFFFVLPSESIYFSLFALVHGIIFTLQLSCAVAYLFIRSFPMETLLKRWTQPDLFIERSQLVYSSSDSASTVATFELMWKRRSAAQIIICAYSHTLGHFSEHFPFKKLAKCFVYGGMPPYFDPGVVVDLERQ